MQFSSIEIDLDEMTWSHQLDSTEVDLGEFTIALNILEGCNNKFTTPFSIYGFLFKL